MSDDTEPFRRSRLIEINAEPGSREALEAQYGKVWDTDQLISRLRGDRFSRPTRRRQTQV